MASVSEDKLIDDGQHPDPFAFLAVKTEIKEEPWDDTTMKEEFKEEVTEEHEFLPQILQKTSMASDKEIPGEDFNTEDFIIEIEKWPAIWDLSHNDYSNKNAKKNAWESVIGKFVPNFTNMSITGKNFIASSYQRKWKSLRDSYTRERSKQKETKSGSAAKYRKKYVLFEQLKFLETATKPTEDSLAVSDEEVNGEEGARMEEGIENPKNDEKQGKTKEKRRRNKGDQNEEFLEILKAKYCRTGESNDDDKLFLLSLHHDLKTLPDHVKLNVKSQIIGVLSSAKQAAYATTTPAVQQFSSSSYQYQLPTFNSHLDNHHTSNN